MGWLERGFGDYSGSADTGMIGSGGAPIQGTGLAALQAELAQPCLYQTVLGAGGANGAQTA